MSDDAGQPQREASAESVGVGDRPEVGRKVGERAAENGPAPHDGDVRGAATAFSDIVSVSAARGVSIVSALVSTTIVTHLLKPSQYSILAYISVMSGLMFSTSASWTSTALTRYGREELEHDGTIRGTSWNRLLVTLPLLSVVIAVIIALKPLGLLPAELTWVIVAIVIAAGLGTIASEHVTDLLEACGRMKLTALSIAGGQMLTVLSIVGLIVAGITHSAAAVATVKLSVVWLVAVGMAAAVWRVGMWPPRIDRARMRRMIRFSLPMIAFAASQYVIGAVDIVILGDYRSTRDVGLYAIAYNGYGILQSVATTATIVLSPLFVSLRAASQEHVIKRFYRRMVPQVLLITAICAGLAAPLLRLIVPIVFGRSFAQAAEPFALLLVAWMFYSAASFVAPILVLHERARVIGMISVVAAVVNVVGDWILIGVCGVGIVGPAIATGACLAVIVFGYFYVAAGCISERVVLPLAVMAPCLVGVAAALALRGVPAIATGAVGTVIAAVIVILWRRPFSAEDADLIAKLDIPRPLKAVVLKAIGRLG